MEATFILVVVVQGLALLVLAVGLVFCFIGGAFLFVQAGERYSALGLAVYAIAWLALFPMMVLIALVTGYVIVSRRRAGAVS